MATVALVTLRREHGKRTVRRIIAAMILAVLPLQVFGLTVVMNATVEGVAGMPVIAGTTNLPPGTELLVSIESPRYTGSAKATVSAGTFRAGPFSNRSAPLSPGRYTISITSGVAEVQPRHVARAFGSDGRNLEGPLTRAGLLGKTVEYTGPLVIGGEAGIRSQAEDMRRAKAKAKDSIAAIDGELKKGEVLLKSHPTDQAVGEQTKRISALSRAAIENSQRFLPRCASAASAAWPLWWYGSVGLYNGSADAAGDRVRYLADYRKQLDQCRHELKAP